MTTQAEVDVHLMQMQMAGRMRYVPPLYLPSMSYVDKPARRPCRYCRTDPGHMRRCQTCGAPKR